MDTLFIFDLDDTIVSPDRQKDAYSLYLKPVHNDISVMMSLFKDINTDKVIVTNRHPLLQTQLEREYGCRVYCRDYCLTIQEMMNHIGGSKWFYQEMGRYKIDTVNKLARDYDYVIFFDDMMHIYELEYLLPNVYIRLPYHLLENGQSEIDGLIDTLVRCNCDG